jgi:hypothetical protein
MEICEHCGEGLNEEAKPRGYREADEARLRAKAERRLLARKGLTWHVASYVIVNLLCWAIWVITSAMMDNWYYVWPIWPMLAWGVGLAFHAVSYYTGGRDAATHEQRVRAEMERLSV